MKFLVASAALSVLNLANAASLAPRAAPVKSFVINVVNSRLAPDGFQRSTVVANGQFPGPVITANKGDTLRVTVNNLLVDPTMRRSTSMDFDGVFLDTPNSFNEGSPGVTACPIGPGRSYTHTLPSVDNQAGTFWYHSQLSLQYADGLRGALIIYDPQDPLKQFYDVDNEDTIWTLADWWHNTTLPMLETYIATQIIPVASSGLFNGRGRFNGGPEVAYDVTPVTTGKRYRFRVINMSARSSFMISVDNHDLTVIETDGVGTQPLTGNKINILAGQRYSLVLTANQPVANYWINAVLAGGNPDRNPELNVLLGRGILRYAGAPNAEPTTPMTLGPDGDGILEGNLKSFDGIPAPEPDFNFTFITALEVNASTSTGFNTKWMINNSSYVTPDEITLSKVLNGASTAAAFNTSENTFVVPANVVIQVEFPATDEDELHPFHMHANNFWVVKSNSTAEINTLNPIRRDVSGASGSGGTIVRFRTDRPGPWFFHCHIFWHFFAGLASVFVSGPPMIRQQTHPTPQWDALCPAYKALPPDLQ